MYPTLIIGLTFAAKLTVICPCRCLLGQNHSGNNTLKARLRVG